MLNLTELEAQIDAALFAVTNNLLSAEQFQLLVPTKPTAPISGFTTKKEI
mgnify:CR=1 FL=1